MRFSAAMLAITVTEQLAGKRKPSPREIELGFVKNASAGYSFAKAVVLLV